MESVRTTDGNDGVFKLYWEFGARIHHDKETPFDPADALATVGLDTSHAAAFDDESWDAVIRAGDGRGLELVGDDVGTPIIAFENSDGVKAGYFGPVISRIPSTEKSVAMWDALVTMMDVDSFFELKRTRTEAPDARRPPPPPLTTAHHPRLRCIRVGRVTQICTQTGWLGDGQAVQAVRRRCLKAASSTVQSTRMLGSGRP